MGFNITEPVREATLKLRPEVWVSAITKDMEDLEGAEVAEITSLLDLCEWPVGSRVLVRREELHPGANYNLFDPGGMRYQALITNSQDPAMAYLEARHRVHARLEDQIKDAKDCGRANFPCWSFQASQVWPFLVQVAQNLLCWAERLCLGQDLWLVRPKRLRYQLLDMAGRMVRSGRRTILGLGANWPWVRDLELAFQSLRALPISPGAGPRLKTTAPHHWIRARLSPARGFYTEMSGYRQVGESWADSRSASITWKMGVVTRPSSPSRRQPESEAYRIRPDGSPRRR